MVDEKSVPSLILNTESLQRKITCLGKRKNATNKISGTLSFKPEDQNLNSHFKPLFISFRSNGEKLIKYQANSSCVIMSVILMSTLFIKKNKDIDITRRNLMLITLRA